MGAYAMPGNTPFRTSKKLKTKRRKTRLDRNAELLRTARLVLDKKNEKIILAWDSDYTIH